MIKAILFDYDDTLVKTKEVKWEAIKETAKRYYSLKLTYNDISQFWGLPFEKMIIGVFKKADTFQNLRSKYYLVSNEFPMKEHENAVDTIKRLIEKYYVGIVTASDRKLVIDDLKLVGFPVKSFFSIQTAADTQFHKPDPRVFEPILRLLEEKRVKRDEILYIGDSTKDFFAARDAGLKFIGIAHSKFNQQEFEKVGAKFANTFQNLIHTIS